MKKIISFVYHEVGDDPLKSGFQNLGAFPYKHKTSHFLSDLKIIFSYFQKADKVTDLDLNSRKNKLMLTFDDGGVSAMNIAILLMERNLIGHFFITTSMIGKNNFLNSNQISKIRKMGHIVGSHSHTHPNIFRDISYDQKIFEWEKSKTLLEEILNEEIICASIPGGAIDNESIRAAGSVGIKYLFNSEPTYLIKEKFGVKVFGRVAAKNTTSSNTIHKWAQGKGFLRSMLIRKIKVIIKSRLKLIFKLYLKIFFQK